MLKRLLIANRGEIAIRVARAAAALGIETVGVFSEDDSASLHLRHVDQTAALPGKGARAYLDIGEVLRAAIDSGCDAVHPGYGFLSENAEFARRCAENGIQFVGPTVDALNLLGDKGQARQLAESCGVPVMRGLSGASMLAEVEAFFDTLPAGTAMLIKAIAGGGGRGMRVVEAKGEIKDAYDRCASEAKAAFGCGDLYVEELIPAARHIEVQVVGDGKTVRHFGERECTLQRRHQKLIEIAPSPSLGGALRERILAAAIRMADELNYRSLGTFEFLVPVDDADERFVFIEANPRLQVEHTVTEEVFGVDLVQTQLRIAGGEPLGQVWPLPQGETSPRGFAVQLRINTETMTAEGAFMPADGEVTAYEPPSGPGVRVDSAGYAGYRPNFGFDSMMAKVIVHSPSPRFADAVTKAYRALCEFRLEGLETNIPLLQALLQDARVRDNAVYTRFIDQNAQDLAAAAGAEHRKLFRGEAGTKTSSRKAAIDVPDDVVALTAAMPGVVVAIEVAEGDVVRAGQSLVVLEAVKMEHPVEAQVSGVVRRVLVTAGDGVSTGQPLVFIDPSADAGSADTGQTVEVDLDYISPRLAVIQERQSRILDAARPDAVKKRHAKGKRMPRENIEDLCDPGSFAEVGGLVVALRHHEMSKDDLITRSPADGVITGFAAVNGDTFGETDARCAVLSFDPTVFAGTLGVMGSKKISRMFRNIRDLRVPLLYFAEGGGGRAGNEYEQNAVSGIDHQVLVDFARLSGRAPLIAMTSGFCFGGNANMLGMCDIVIATEESSVGVGGPALIEGGGLGVYRPEDVGPMSIQAPNGVVDIVVADEAEAVVVARKAVSYFQGPLTEWSCADQRLLRSALPENRLRAYDIRALVETMADTGSVLELRRAFAPNTMTALARIEGQAVGVIASDCREGGGAIDADGSDKAARFARMCETFGLPIVFLCDCPGFLIGPESERQALIRRSGDLLITLVNLSVPVISVVLRKAYGVGAAAMMGGTSVSNVLCVAWPTAEYGHMGPEGNAKLGFKQELAAIADPEAQKAFLAEKVAETLAWGDPMNVAMFLEVDNIIDPADTRFWVTTGLRSAAGDYAPPR